MRVSHPHAPLSRRPPSPSGFTLHLAEKVGFEPTIHPLETRNSVSSHRYTIISNAGTETPKGPLYQMSYHLDWRKVEVSIPTAVTAHCFQDRPWSRPGLPSNILLSTQLGSLPRFF